MTDKTLKALLRQASQASAGPTPSFEQIQRRPRARKAWHLPAWLVTGASAVAAVAMAVVLLPDAAPPLMPEDGPDNPVYLTELIERSDFLTLASASGQPSLSRSDWLLASYQDQPGFYASDALLPASEPQPETYVLVDENGWPLTDPENPNFVYLIERTTP